MKNLTSSLDLNLKHNQLEICNSVLLTDYESSDILSKSALLNRYRLSRATIDDEELVRLLGMIAQLEDEG